MHNLEFSVLLLLFKRYLMRLIFLGGGGENVPCTYTHKQSFQVAASVLKAEPVHINFVQESLHTYIGLAGNWN